jgi:hypothetical protein
MVVLKATKTGTMLAAAKDEHTAIKRMIKRAYRDSNQGYFAVARGCLQMISKGKIESLTLNVRG